MRSSHIMQPHLEQGGSFRSSTVRSIAIAKRLLGAMSIIEFIFYPKYVLQCTRMDSPKTEANRHVGEHAGDGVFVKATVQRPVQRRGQRG